MRRPLIAGNWKLNKTLAEAETLAAALVTELADVTDTDILIAPVGPPTGAIVSAGARCRPHSHKTLFQPLVAM